MADFNGAVTAPFPTCNGTINAVNGAVTAPFPSVNGQLFMATVLAGAVTAPFPISTAVMNRCFSGQVEAPFPSVAGELLIGSRFDSAVVAPFPTASGKIDAAFMGAVIAPMPVVNAILAASIPDFSGMVTAPFPKTSGTLALQIVGTNTVLVMNLKNKIVSIYEDFDFNSACRFNGAYLGAAADGIHIMDGADDNGDQINASFTLGDADFGVPNIKALPEAFFTYSGNGELQVFLSVDQDEEMGDADNEEGEPYPVPQPTDGKTQTKRAKFPKGLRGGHWQMRIENVDGCDFNLQSIGLPVEISKRRLN